MQCLKGVGRLSWDCVPLIKELKPFLSLRSYHCKLICQFIHTSSSEHFYLI